MTKTAFLDMVEASQKGTERSTSAQELNNPIDIEEQHRESVYPDICTPECKHITCGYRTEENKGRPCFMKWQQYETPLPKVTQTIEEQVDPLSLVNRIMKKLEPTFEKLRELDAKLTDLENQAMITETPKFNSQPIRVDIGTNQERINND